MQVFANIKMCEFYCWGMVKRACTLWSIKTFFYCLSSLWFSSLNELHFHNTESFKILWILIFTFKRDNIAGN